MAKWVQDTMRIRDGEEYLKTDISGVDLDTERYY